MPPPGPAGRRTTLVDVAAAAGVSTALVSIVVRGAPGASEATRQRVLQVADELGYRPDTRARLLRSSRSRLLGVVFGVQQAFHGDLLAGLYASADRYGYTLALSAVTPGRDEQRAVDDLVQDRCEGLVLLGPDLPAPVLSALAGRLPVVVVARPVRSTTVDVVRTADARGLELAVDHLVDLGHRRVVHVDGGPAPGAAERRRGYRRAMQRRGLGDEVRVVPGGVSEDDGAAAVAHLLAGTLPSAVAVFNDRCAVGVLAALRAEGVDVPGEVSVVGYDDSRLARLHTVRLTTVGQDADVLADLAVARAADRLDGRPVSTREQVVAPHLVVRDTTAPHPAASRRARRPGRSAQHPTAGAAAGRAPMGTAGP